MKTTLHYIIAILLLSLNATHAFAEGEEGPFNITYRGDNVTYSYNNDQTLLTIGGVGSITITGDGTSVNARIEIQGDSRVSLTIQDLHIQAEVPLTVNSYSSGDASKVTNIILKGTNILESNAADSRPGMSIGWSTSISGSGSLTVKGSTGGAGIGFGKFYESSTPMIIQDNIVVVAIGGIDASGIDQTKLPIQHKGGLLIQGKVDGYGTIEHTSSALAGDLTLGTNFEIPEWATVTIPKGKTITVPEGITLTNEGTLETEEGGSLTNQGSIINNGTLETKEGGSLTNQGSLVNKGTLETENGTLVNEGTIETNGIKTSSKFLNIEGENGFDVSSTSDRATFTYNAENKLLTISGGGGDALLEGIGKNIPVDCGIVITGGSLDLTIKDLNIRADNALVFEDQMPNVNYYPILIGANRLESTSGSGINIHGNTLVIQGPGSLTVIGETEAFTATGGSLSIRGNACVVAIGGEGVTSGITTFDFTSGLLISGTKQAEDSITEDYSELKGDNITLGGNLEIPEWATVTIADGQTFTIASNVTLTNKGTIKNEGTLAGTPVVGTLPQHRITFKANDSESTADVERYITEGETLPTDIFTRSGYTFQGWYTAADGGTKVETVARAQTLYAQWEADEPAVEPEPPYIPPVPIYYNVYLPQVEGATTDPGPGEYEVESWDNFRFYLTIDSAYSESQPVVTTDRGETLVPRSSDGAYLVNDVCSDVEIFIDGLIQNPPPVANEAISTDALAPQIWAEGSMLCIRMAEALPSAPVRIFTVDGRLYDSFDSTPGLNRRQLPTGVYIVRVGDTACKVIVK